MKKDASATLAEGWRGDENALTAVAHQFRSLQERRQRYCDALSRYLRKKWCPDAEVMTCSLARTTARDAVYTFVVSGQGRTYSFDVSPRSKIAYDEADVEEVGPAATARLRTLTPADAE